MPLGSSLESHRILPEDNIQHIRDDDEEDYLESVNSSGKRV